MLQHYLGKLENQNFAYFVHIKPVLCDFSSSIQQMSVKCHENTCKDEHYVKYQQFTVCSFTVLNKLRTLQLSKVSLSTNKHQHSNNLTPWAEATWTKNTQKVQIVCKSLFTKGVQNVHHLHGHMLGDAFSTAVVNCSVDNVLSEIGPYCN